MQSYALPGSTARQLFNSSTLLDSSTHDSSTRQISTELDSAPRVLDTPAHAVSLDLPRRARQLLDSYSKGATGKAFDSPSRQRPRRTACVGRRRGRRLDSRRQLGPRGQPGLKMRTGSYGVPAAREMSRAMVYGNKKFVVLYTASNALRLLASSQSLRLRAPAPRAEGRSQSAINHRRAAQVVCSSSGGIRVVEQPAAERWQIELNCIHMGTQLCRGTAGRFT